MPTQAALVAVAVLLTHSFGLGRGRTCPGALGDSKTDDWKALQRCLDSEAGEAIELNRGATYLISRELELRRRKRIFGGATAHSVQTTIQCASKEGQKQALFVLKGAELKAFGVHVEGCHTGITTRSNLTLVNSTLSNHENAGVVALDGRVTMKGSAVRGVRRAGVRLATAGGQLVMLDGSEIASSKFGVDIKYSGEVELHSSVIKDCRDTAIKFAWAGRSWQHHAPHLRLLLAGQSSLRSSGFRCVSVHECRDCIVSLEGSSQLEDCGRTGILVNGGRSVTVVLRGGSQISNALTGILLSEGRESGVAIEGGSSVHGSHFDGILIKQGTSHRVSVSGGSWIKRSGGSGIHLQGGGGHSVVIAGGSSVRESSYGARLTASNSSLSVEDSAIQKCSVSAIHIRPAQGAAADTGCTMVNLQSAYLVHNSRGFWCESTCALGEASGIFYLNGADFQNDCSGSLSLQGPLAATTRFSTLKVATWSSSLFLAVAVAAMPWLVLCLHKQPSGLYDSCPLLSVLGWVAVSAVLFFIRAGRTLEIGQVLRHLKREDLEEEGVKSLFAVAVALPPSLLHASLAARCWWQRRRRVSEVLELMGALEESLWQGDAQAERDVCAKLVASGFSPKTLGDKVRALRRQQSQEAGVSVAYLLSSDFLSLARARTGLENPTFLQMKDSFWGREDAIGKEVFCPRDARLGCALVDTLHPRHRQRCTHFLSWVWRYPVLMVREALHIWTEEEGLDPNSTFLFMCFFVNNQFRILIEGTQGGADDLETTFERNLQRIGRVVALLDHWQQPLYLSRIWTIFEQYMAAKLQLPVTVILNQAAGESLVAELDKGREGIKRITDTLCEVHAEMAEASVKSDEEHVKALIRRTIGFSYVDQRVRNCMIDWVAAILRQHMDHLVQETRAGGATGPRSGLLRRVSCLQLQGAASGMSIMEIEEP